jgi:hypothetical protein
LSDYKLKAEQGGQQYDRKSPSHFHLPVQRISGEQFGARRAENFNATPA